MAIDGALEVGRHSIGGLATTVSSCRPQDWVDTGMALAQPLEVAPLEVALALEVLASLLPLLLGIRG